jgi:hypothetical protein
LVFSLSGQAHAALLINISKSQQQLTVSVDGAPTYRWPVSTGRAGYDTPSGSFRPYRLEQVWFSSKFDDAPMPHSVFFHEGYAVHGTLEASKLGRAVSHGCVRLARDNAALLFELVKRHGMQNARVVISDGPSSVQASAPNLRLRSREARYSPPSDYQSSSPPSRWEVGMRQVDMRQVDMRDVWPSRNKQDYKQAESRSRTYGHQDGREQNLRRIYREAGFRW